MNTFALSKPFPAQENGNPVVQPLVPVLVNIMKICCYAIAKNETKNVDAWVASMRESDGMYVLDTGSTDDTISKLKDQGVIVKEMPMLNGTFRFDVARNASLDMVPEDADLCVCTDMDETYNPGWREKLESQWAAALAIDEKLKWAEYDYVLGRDSNGKVTDKFNGFRIHVRKGAKWIYACHEVLQYEGESHCVFISGIALDHHKDFSKPRSSYVKLLELDVSERPDEARPSHYLGREYMYLERWDDAIKELKRHLTIKGAWIGERAQSMRFIGRCYRRKKEFELAECWYLRAIAESKEQREAALELSQMALENGNGELGALAAKLALAVTRRNGTYLTEVRSWGYAPYDYLAIGETMSKTGSWQLKAKGTSKALSYQMYDKRLWRNLVNCNGRSPVYPPPKEATAVIEAWQKDKSDKMVDWGKFDRIFCIHYVEDKCRLASMKMEFDRVGLSGRDNFEIVETVRSPYEKNFATGGDANPGIRNLALNTLRVLLRSKVHGYKRILIMEDDVRFLKDIGLMADIFAASPNDADIICYDKMNYLYPPEYWDLCEKRKVNRHYCGWDTGIYSGACYSLSQIGMDACIDEYNKHLVAPDDALQVGGVNKAFSYVSVSCQQCHRDALYIERYGGYNMKNGYAFQGLDYALYNVDEGYGYDPMFKDEEVLV